MDVLADFLARFKPPGKVLFSKVWGSRSHNCEKITSDTDFSGVYIIPTRGLLACRLPQEPGPPETWKHDSEDSKDKVERPDHSFHEVGKFCDLLLKGNPGIIEMLFTDRLCRSMPEWYTLRLVRREFLSRDVVKQYLGFMTGQMKRLINGQRLNTATGKYNEKWAYHIVRLSEDAKRIAMGGEPVVWKEGEERDFLMKIRCEEFAACDIQKIMEEKIQAVGFCLDMSLIPEHGNKQLLNNWLLDLREKYW